jgi:outer membrane biosynthesis protein TonB
MNLGRQLVVFVLALGMLFVAGCQKRPPQLAKQAKAPADPIPSSLPVEISELTPPPPPPPAPKQEPPPAEQPKPQPVQHHKQRKPKQPPATTPNNAPGAGVGLGNTTIAAARPPANSAAEAAPPDTAIAAEVTSAQLSQQKQTTAQLLDETEKTLNSLNRPLSHDEEGIVTQIRSYVTQSVSATKEGDFERAYNLATKAHLLSAALVKK